MRFKFTPKRIERFWSLVDTSAGPDACWPWMGNLLNNGYPRYSQDLAHRISYIIVNGPHPKDKPFTCHHCDFPPCVNPFHLFAGTGKDNADDREFKNRGGDRANCGEKNGLAKLTEGGVKEIRKRWLGGESQANLGRSYGVLITTINLVVHRKTWRHVE